MPQYHKHRHKRHKQIDEIEESKSHKSTNTNKLNKISNQLYENRLAYDRERMTNRYCKARLTAFPCC